jgi:ubiquitin-conjugating enzyme E2 J1
MADNHTSYNTNHPSIRRLLREVKEMEKENNNEFQAFPLEVSIFLIKCFEDNLFEWHFTIRGPSETEFEGGIYHGRIILPPEYPFKPPHIVWLTVIIVFLKLIF